MDLAPGTLVTPNVRLVELLGQGGMGSVWIADHLALGTRVAVKFVAADLIDEDPAVMERFNREASMSAQIKSPYVVQIFDHGVMGDGQPFIVMELLEGESLAERLSRTGALPLDMAAQVVSQTAKALSKAHKLGVVHRDIKPDNLFLTFEDDELFLKVLDFGIAKQTNLPQAQSVTHTGMMVGTPEYMSPEQVLSSKTVDQQADLWALAVVAFHCLTGGVPFSGETIGSLCVAIANNPPPPVTSLRPGLPPAMDAWFTRALDKNPRERFENAKQLAMTFGMVLTGELLEDFSTVSGVHTQPDWSGGHAPVTRSGAQRAVQISGAGQASGAGQISGAGHGAATFAGTTRSGSEPTSKGRVRALLVALVALVAVGGGAAFVIARDDTPTPEDAPQAHRPSEQRLPDLSSGVEESSDGDEGDPEATGAETAAEASAEAAEGGADSSAGASASASASSKMVATPPSPRATSTWGHGKLPLPQPTSKPQPTTVDRGF